MIDTAVVQVAQALNSELQRTLRLSEQLVVVSGLYEPDGSPAAHVQNKLALFLVGIERDTTPELRPAREASGGRPPRMTQPVALNLLLMFAAAFSASNYAEALKLVSSTIAFFQATPVLDHHNLPDLDPRIDRLTLDIENLGLADLSHVWGTFGGRYQPSVLYRLRLITISSGRAEAQQPVVRQTQTGAGR